MGKKNEKGFALVMALVLFLVMSLMGGGLIVITSGDHKSNNTSDQYQQAFYVAETGLIQAEKTIVNQYLGPWMKVSDIDAPGPDASAEDTAAYNVFKAEALAKQGTEIDKKFIKVTGGNVKRLGKYNASVRLHRSVVVDITFEVVAEK